MTTPAAVTAKPRPPFLFRWTVLVFISLAMFGNYYVYDAVSPLADVLKAQLKFSDADIGWLQAIYSLPNILMVLIGGLIIDWIGTRKATFLFGVLCFIGAAVTVISPNLEMMAAGRLIFGLGAESLIVAVTTAIAKWFRGKELGFAMGLNLTIARLGSFLALNSPSWAGGAYNNWQTPLLIAVAFSTFCIVGAVIYWLLENNAEKKYEIGSASTEKMNLRDIFRFSGSYWMIVALCVTFYSAVFPFQTFAVKFFMEAHHVTRETGGFLSSMLTLFAMICTPLFGLLVDRVGKRSFFMMAGTALLLPLYLIMAYTNISLYIPMALMGVAFSLIPAVMWPSVTYVVEEQRLGTAYGLMTLIQNVGLFGFNFIIGWANDTGMASAANPGGYALGMWIFTGLVLFGFLFSWLLRRSEMGPRGHGLETITTKTGA